MAAKFRATSEILAIGHSALPSIALRASKSIDRTSGDKRNTRSTSPTPTNVDARCRQDLGEMGTAASKSAGQLEYPRSRAGRKARVCQGTGTAVAGLHDCSPCGDLSGAREGMRPISTARLPAQRGYFHTLPARSQRACRKVPLQCAV